MFDAGNGTVRRLSLLAGASMGAVWLAAAPTSALAANECGDPSANAASNDTFVCAGALGSIVYPGTNGNLTLQLRAPLTVTNGIAVTPTGTNTVTISRTTDTTPDAGDPVIGNTAGAAINVERTTGGTITVNLSDNDAADTPAIAVTGTTAGIRLRNAGTGASSVTTTNGVITATAGAGIDLATTGTGSLTVTNGATVSGSTAAISVASGNNLTVTNNATGVLEDLLTFANTGNTTLSNNGRWNAGGDSTLRNAATLTGSTTLNNNATGVLATNFDGAATSIAFGAGGATFNNAGTLAAGHGAEAAATLTLTSLAAWNNSGLVLFGANEDASASDGAANDRVVMTRAEGGTFTGSGASRLVMDVDFSASQLDCAAAVTADCLDLRGHSTAGTTVVSVNTVQQGFGSERIVLVDVTGEGEAAGVFTLDPESAGFRDIDGGLLDAGLFLYTIENSAAAGQHALVAVSPDGEALELALIGRQASEPWRTATGMWHDRQADLRNTLAGRTEGYAPGAWLKVAAGFIDETRKDPLDIGGDIVAFNTAYEQETTAVVGGIDLLRFIGANSAWVLGVTAGQVKSSLDYAVAATELDIEGQSFGAYASVLAGRAFFDAIINATDLDLTHNGFGAEFEGAAQSIGYQLEGGYRLFQVNEEGAWVEPLASLSYVRTTVDDIAFGGGTTAEFDDAASLRGAVGLRLGGDLVMDALTASFSATGRLWKELDGDNASTLAASFGDTEFVEQGLDDVSELGVAASFFALGGRLSAHVAYNVLFREDYQNTGASVGLRYNW